MSSDSTGKGLFGGGGLSSTLPSSPEKGAGSLSGLFGESDVASALTGSPAPSLTGTTEATATSKAGAAVGGAVATVVAQSKAAGSPVKPTPPPMPPPPALTSQEQKQTEELLKSWEGRFNELAKTVKVAAETAVEIDQEYTSISDQVQVLKNDHHDLWRKQEAAELSMQLIHDQQELLSDLLGHLEIELDLGSTAKKSRSSIRLEERSRSLNLQLDELTRQAQHLTELIGSQARDDPMEQMAHLLAAHQSELDAVQERLNASEKQLKAQEASFA